MRSHSAHGGLAPAAAHRLAAGVRPELEGRLRRLPARIVPRHVPPPPIPAAPQACASNIPGCSGWSGTPRRRSRPARPAGCRARAKTGGHRTGAGGLGVRQVGNAAADGAAQRAQNPALPRGRLDRPHWRPPQPDVARGRAGLQKALFLARLEAALTRRPASRHLDPADGVTQPSMPHSVAASW